MRINKLVFSFLIISAAIAMASVLVAEATSKEDIVYPVPELGNCGNEAACKTYCDNSDNLPQCIRFAKKHNLLEGQDIPDENVEKLADAMKGGGPGGCKTQRECESYCNKPDNMSACIEFAERSGFLTGRELEEAKKVKTALDRGAKLPAGCTNRETCEATCKDPKDKETARSCFAFAKEAGLLPPDFDDAKTERMFELIDRGEVDFKKMQKCDGLERGEITDAETINTCLDVGEKLGFMKPGEKEMARRMLTDGGPGGCRGRQCQEVCEKNPETCLQYFEEKGIALPEEAQGRIKEGLGQMKQALSGAPPEVLECLKADIGADVFEQIESGTIKASQMAKLGPRMGQIMQGCFMKASGGEEGFGPPGDKGFPGGPGGPSGPAGNMPEGVQQCFEELGLQFPPRKPPSADEQTKIGECMRARSGGPEDRPGDKQGSNRREFRPSEEFQGRPESSEGKSMPTDFDKGGPPQGPTKEQFNDQFQKEFDKQYQQQYQEQYQKQIQQIQGQLPQGFDPSQIPQGQIPSSQGLPSGTYPSQSGNDYPSSQPGVNLPSGSYPSYPGSPSGGYQPNGGSYPPSGGGGYPSFPSGSGGGSYQPPSGGYQPPSGGGSYQPPSGGFQPPSGGSQPLLPPSSYINPPSLLGFFAQILLGL